MTGVQRQATLKYRWSLGWTLALLATARIAEANLSRALFEGDRSSVLVPDGATAVGVDREDLSFVLVTGEAADVAATYSLTNSGSARESEDIVFAFLEGVHGGDVDNPHASIAVDGAPVAFRTVKEPDAAGRWSTHGRERRPDVDLLLFHLEFGPGQTRIVTVRYRQNATVDRRKNVHPTFHFDYLLSPAKHWAGFGALDVTLRLPPNYRLSTSSPFQCDRDDCHMHSSGLPNGELEFETTSLAGLWFGASKPAEYLAMMAAAVAWSTVLVGTGAGRRWSGVRHRVSGVLPLVIGGTLSLGCSLAVVFLLVAVFPPGALGFGYGPWVVSSLLIVLSVPLGVMASALSARAGRRKRAGTGQSLGDPPPTPSPVVANANQDGK